MALTFLCDGQIITAEAAAGDTLLEYLRTRMGRKGTKEGCAEGDCGACTVLVGSLKEAGDGIDWRAVNACIQLLPMLDGKALLTVESLGAPDALHPLQASMAANGASQCGFCTPGFVMSLYGRGIGARGCELALGDALAGNLCRCTGYGPILAAGAVHGVIARDDAALVARLKALPRADMAQGGQIGAQWFAPRSIDRLDEVLARYPDARIIAGATDVGLWVTKKLVELGQVIFIGDIAELARIEETEAGLTLGAGVRYADAHGALARLSPPLGELVRRIGGLQVRNAGTIGGNIANGSPIGDGPPALIALDARVTLRSAKGRRTIALEDYFIAYGRQDRAPGEVVESLFVPRPAPGDIVHISKLSKRFDSDISAVCGAFRLSVADGVIASARVCFGGMAGTPARARACEAALTGQAFAETAIRAAAEALAADYAPLDDVRGSAAYRRKAAVSLLWRMWYEAQGVPVSLEALAHG